jgi:hypothetical protein
MSAILGLRFAVAFACILSVSSVLSQTVPPIPPSSDPAFWGRTNAPYISKLTVTTSSVNGSNTPQTRVQVVNVCRDSTGRVREEQFYTNGRPMSVSVRDPNKNTFTSMMVVPKTFFVAITHRPTIPPPGKGWTVEVLPPRVIDGIPADGLRFTRTVPAPADGNGAPDTMIDEEWISNSLSAVLEQKTVSQRYGTTIRTVSHLEKAEPDPALFTIPSDYTEQRVGVAPQP